MAISFQLVCHSARPEYFRGFLRRIPDPKNIRDGIAGMINIVVAPNPKAVHKFSGLDFVI